jgi:phosphatidylglycerophosphate synthase
MPELDGGTDKFLYENIINKMAKRLCDYPIITPNIITTINFLVFKPLVIWNFHKDRSIVEGVVLFITVLLLDSLDGALARECKKESNFGMLYDMLTDNLFMIILAALALYKGYNSKKLGKYRVPTVITSVMMLVFITYAGMCQICKTYKAINNDEVTDGNYSDECLFFSSWIDKKYAYMLHSHDILVTFLAGLHTKLFLTYFCN